MAYLWSPLFRLLVLALTWKEQLEEQARQLAQLQREANATQARRTHM